MNASKEQLFEALGNPEVEPLTHVDHVLLQHGLPTQLVKVAEWADWVDEDEEDI